DPGVEHVAFPIDEAPAVTHRLRDLLRVPREAVPLVVERREEVILLAERAPALVFEEVGLGGRRIVGRRADTRQVEAVAPVLARIAERQGRVCARAVRIAARRDVAERCFPRERIAGGGVLGGGGGGGEGKDRQ